MSTWTSRLSAACLAVAPLAGCDTVEGLPFVPSGGGGFAIGGEGRPRTAEVELAGGAVVLAAPEGYCIDKRSLKRTKRGGFAVMARCDTLGVKGSFRGYDLALITVASQPREAGAKAPTAQAVARTAGKVKVLNQRTSRGLALVRLADGPHDLEGVSRVHWRGAFAVGDNLVGLGLYAVDGSGVLGAQGGLLLEELTRKTRAASAKAVAEATD